MEEKYSIKELKDIIEHEKYLRKENQQLYEELQVLRKNSDVTNDLANEYYKRIKKAVEYIEHSKFIKEQVIMKSNYDMQDFQIRKLLNILNGDEDKK